MSSCLTSVSDGMRLSNLCGCKGRGFFVYMQIFFAFFIYFAFLSGKDVSAEPMSESNSDEIDEAKFFYPQIKQIKQNPSF